MSRTRHKLQSEDWYGEWARYFHRENREMRERGREKRRASVDDLAEGLYEYEDDREEKE